MDQLIAFIALLYVLGFMACAVCRRLGLFDVVNVPERLWVHECDQCGWKRHTLYRPKKDGAYGWTCEFCVDRNAALG